MRYALFALVLAGTMLSQSLKLLPRMQRLSAIVPLHSFGTGFETPGGSKIPKPTIITPSRGSQYPQLEKFLMMYTCKICTGRNAQMISKVAYNNGMVVSTCRHCKSKHLIADNEGKLDMQEYGRKIEDYLQQKNETVRRINITPKDLEDNYLVDTDGVISLVSKMGGQLPVDVSIIDMPVPGAPLPPLPLTPPPPARGGGGFQTERIVE